MNNNNKQQKILIIEDDKNMGFLLKEYLTACSFDVDLCENGHSGLERIRRNNFTLCLVDVMLPGIDGFSIAQTVKKEFPALPLVFITARTAKEDKIKGFNLGADDYITKPFDEEELLCRINAVINRYNLTGAVDSVAESYEIGVSVFKPKIQMIIRDNKFIKLSNLETELLTSLCQSKNDMVKRSDLLLKLWGKDDYYSGRSLDVFITRLRKLISIDPNLKIENVQKKGYILTDTGSLQIEK